jgi:hypothetical protein
MRDAAVDIPSVASFVGLGLGDAISVIARARNHLQADKSLPFRFEVTV